MQELPQCKIAVKIEANKTWSEEFKGIFFFCSHFFCSLQNAFGYSRHVIQFPDSLSLASLPTTSYRRVHKSFPHDGDGETYSNLYICDWFQVLDNLPVSWYSFFTQRAWMHQTPLVCPTHNAFALKYTGGKKAWNEMNFYSTDWQIMSKSVKQIYMAYIKPVMECLCARKPLLPPR